MNRIVERLSAAVSPSVFFALLVVLLPTGRPVVWAADDATGEEPSWTVDHRYGPPWWQTSICLPDDWQKTLVGKEGSLLYDYRGPYNDFKTRITAGLSEGTEWVRQELVSPRVPIVRTLKRSGPVEIVEEAFAVAPRLEPARDDEQSPPPVVERMGEASGLSDWAQPTVKCEPAFRRIAVGWNEPVRYRIRAAAADRHTVVLGLCEGWHKTPGQRVLDLKIEGKTRKTVDMVAEKGHNVPALFPLPARDEDGDGWIDVTVAAAEGSRDGNTILNVLWVFPGEELPPAAELFSGRSSRPSLAQVDCGSEPPRLGPPRHDVLIVRLHNSGQTDVTVTPTLTIESQFPSKADPAKRLVHNCVGTTVVSAEPFELAEQTGPKLVLRMAAITLPAGGQRTLAFGVARGYQTRLVPQDVAEAESLRARAETYWNEVDLPYGHIQVPDAAVQAQLDSAIRNIYQAREIKNGLPAFQVGPTCYRGLWVVDGAFLLEAVTFLGRDREVRSSIDYLLSFQRDDGAFMLIDGHWKETGIVLWAVTRHARLTNDKQWLSSVWPKLERAFAYIQKMRQTAADDPNAPNHRLIPVGFSDGGLGGKYPEYTNIYWTLAGLRAAVEAARWLEKNEQADEWQREYDDLYATFRKAAERDGRTDVDGNHFVPIRMVDDQGVAPQKAQWAFLHAVFPGKVFATDDPLVRGNMAMLRAVESEGLVYGTGWLSEGIWSYFGSFYGHGWLWLGEGQKAAEILYAFANHASPLLAWREEHMPQGKGNGICGDMPHNWASAEFIRLVRHLLVLRRGQQLHLCEGMSERWARPGDVTRLVEVLTEFGPISLQLQVAADGKTASLQVVPPRRNPPKRIVLHLAGWARPPDSKDTIDLPADETSTTKIELIR